MVVCELLVLVHGPDLGDTQLEVKIVLPWKEEVKLEYHVVTVSIIGLLTRSNDNVCCIAALANKSSRVSHLCLLN